MKVIPVLLVEALRNIQPLEGEKSLFDLEEDEIKMDRKVSIELDLDQMEEL